MQKKKSSGKRKKGFREKAQEFLAVSPRFKLGDLPTEQGHPYSHNLSHCAKHNPGEAIAVLKKIDQEALEVLRTRVEEIHRLSQAVHATLQSGRRIYICGCGATGRLALFLETLWRRRHQESSVKENVIGFMAGGDVALIKSLEHFEDSFAYGRRQLVELGFTDGDLLISCTEGGETPFVIGATQKAALLSVNKPFFLYCNPDDILCTVAARSKKVIENRAIVKINLCVGPMAIAGSTRMQATTVLMAAAGLGLFMHDDTVSFIRDSINTLINFWSNLDTLFLKEFIIRESLIYRNNEYLLYEADPDFGITILTDTTERSPTFSLVPFENSHDEHPLLSLCYLYFPQAEDSLSAWNLLLDRPPRTLQWPRLHQIASHDRLLGYDFSRKLIDRRKISSNNTPHHCFKIAKTAGCIAFTLDKNEALVSVPGLNILFEHLILKMLLNTHSTLVMGRLGRYEHNVMTHVRPSNNKLIDRTIRYVDYLLRKKKIHLPYGKLAYACFEMMDKIKDNEPLVLRTVEEISRKKKYKDN